MRFKTKYRFWAVFLVLLVVFILLGCVIIISNALYPNEAAMRELGSVPAHTYVIRYTEGFLFMVVFFYFTTNYYYNLLAEKKKFISFLKVSVIILLACFAYDTILFY